VHFIFDYILIVMQPYIFGMGCRDLLILLYYFGLLSSTRASLQWLLLRVQPIALLIYQAITKTDVIRNLLGNVSKGIICTIVQ
jgi:hypothetical protein